jgi:hypothetical protein
VDGSTLRVPNSDENRVHFGGYSAGSTRGERGDWLVEMEVSREVRRQNSSWPRTFHPRALQYRRSGYAPQTLLTSLLDPERYPADEIRALYHERWELALGYDELKTEMQQREEREPAPLYPPTTSTFVCALQLGLRDERLTPGGGPPTGRAVCGALATRAQ